jgi:hypothetical protein
VLSVDELQERIESLGAGEVLCISRRKDLARRCVLYVQRLDDVVVPEAPSSADPVDGPVASWAAPVSAAADPRRFVVGVPAPFSSALTGFEPEDGTSPYPGSLTRSVTGVTATAVLGAATATAAGIEKWTKVAFDATTEPVLRARLATDAAAEFVISSVSGSGSESVAVRCIVVRLGEFDDSPLVRVEADLVARGAKRKAVARADELVELGRLLRSKDGGVMHVQYVFADPLDPAALRFAIDAAVATARRLEPVLVAGKAESALLPAG